jgi:hypothetical protein
LNGTNDVPSDSERKERLEAYLDDKKALKGLDRSGQGTHGRIEIKALVALYQGTLLNKLVADHDGGKDWFSVEKVCSMITGWNCVTTPFTNTVKRHFERLEKAGCVLHREQFVPSHGLVDQYAITDEGADYCHDKIPAWKKGLYPAFLVLAKLGDTVKEEAKSRNREALSWFSTDEERKLAYEFLKYIFDPEPDLRAQFYEEKNEKNHGSEFSKRIRDSDRHWRLENRIAYVTITPPGSGAPSFFGFATLDDLDGSSVFDITYALQSLKDSHGAMVANTFKDKLVGCKHTGCERNLNRLKDFGTSAICGHMVRTIVEELLETWGFQDKQEWSKFLLNEVTFLKESLRKLQGLQIVLRSEEDRLAAYRIMTSSDSVLVDMLSEEDLRTLDVHMGYEEIVWDFIDRLEEKGVVRVTEKTDTVVAFRTINLLFQKISVELWKSGSYYQLVLPSGWRSIIARALPHEQS